MSFLADTSKEALNTITNAEDFIDDLSTKYILKPLGARGIGGFVFDIPDEAKVTLSADITDHWVEDNTTVNDQIAIKPDMIALSGFVGELPYIFPGNVINSVEGVAQSTFAEIVEEKLHPKT